MIQPELQMMHAVDLLARVGSQVLLTYDTLFTNNFFILFFLLRNTFTYSI